MPIVNTKRLSVLGCTGSVGRQTLDVALRFGIPVAALAAGHDSRAAEDAARVFHPEILAMVDEKAAGELKISLADTDVKILSGAEGVAEAAAWDGADTVVNAVSGIAGLAPTMAAISAGKKLCLANKESLVAAGDTVMKAVRDNNVRMIPVDSEHSAVFQCLAGGGVPERIILTCSGGPFFGRKAEQLENVSASDALAHPTWNMGARITVDSATLMNKGFEVIEASHLFGVPADRIDVTVHRESTVHSMVQFGDGAIIAQLSPPDMRLCVMYALSYPDRFDCGDYMKRLDFSSPFSLSFAPPDVSVFTLLPLAYECLRRGGVSGAALNGADEQAVGLFLSGKIGLTGIMRSVEYAAMKAPVVHSPTLEDIYAADAESRRRVLEYFKL